MKEKIYNIVIKILVTLFGRRFVYAIRYYRLRQRWPNFNQPQDLSEYLINKITTNQTHSYAPLGDKIYFGELTFTPSAGLLDARTTQAITHYATLLKKNNVSKIICPS